MHITLGALAILSLQQGFTTPPGGDTVGYWQQRVAYTIVAHLDEAAQRVRARGTMRYVNNSPDTLRELYVHQYLNAFRPNSKWSAADDAEGRVRFQHLGEPDFAYERFTAPVRVNGQTAGVMYPGAPDSTVARIALPAPLLPGDSVDVSFEWDARPSTLPRRQGRRGRHWDLAQWYPRIAPYDRGGWQFNALQPAGEFYGEFGSYDVTLIVRDDQVIGATGVPVSGDPGWTGARRSGAVHPAATAYADVAPAPSASAPAAHKAVRFVARDVHHFAWSASPEYRYEGGVYVRTPPPGRVRAWDTVAIHVLYQPGDDSTWGGGRVVGRTRNSIRWLESVFGRYAYPQMTVLHRVEGGGTEFPMMQMNGSPSQGLNLHEGGHVWAHGILANNEWRSGWLDEGLTSYQTDWAQGFTPQERVRAGVTDRFADPTGYRARAATMAIPRFEVINLQMALTDLQGDAQPIGTVAHEFRDFSTYNTMIYTRAQVMYGQLRDVLGDSAWVAFLHDYYDRWALKHVDERAMLGASERVSGKELDWFFAQWVHHTGVTDYALGDVHTSSDGGRWTTRAEVVKRGEYFHPMRVGVRTATGWTIVQAADPLAERQVVQIETLAEPLDVRLDPHHFSWDWDRRNDGGDAGPRYTIDWPFLRQSDRDRTVIAYRPLLWYSEPGGANVALRQRSSYLALIDQYEVGVAYALRGVPTENALQLWGRVENPTLPFFDRPLMGWGASIARLDDVLFVQGTHRLEFKRPRLSGWYGGRITYTDLVSDVLVPEFWSPGPTLDYSLTVRPRWQRGASQLFVDFSGVGGRNRDEWFGKGELAAGFARMIGPVRGRARLYGAMTDGAVPAQRALLLNARDPVSTFEHHWWRPAGSILKQDWVNGLPLGGAGLRGYDWRHAATRVAAANVELSRELLRSRKENAPFALGLNAFADVAVTDFTAAEALVDAGLGLALAGRLFDRDIALRLDAPLYLSHPALARNFATTDHATVSWRYALSFTDIWPD